MKQFFFRAVVMVSFSCLMLLVDLISAGAQNLPEYNNSAVAWNSTTHTSIQLVSEEFVRKDKVNSAYGAMFSKKAAMKTVIQFNGPKSKARIVTEDTLKIFVKIDKDLDPKSIIKVYKAAVDNNNREVSVMETSKRGEIKRSDGDFNFTLKKLSPGIFRVAIVGVKAADELFFYIGTHDSAMAKLTLGID